ncbi:MAG: 16S rRNA (cytosine(967)-C(5))-methyltransferase RsmB [Clostridia bacterium]|nr:16S rRNA (cytosine(967)-C(5))-methyltransferase RsmB [Clostridia bacterium]
MANARKVAVLALGKIFVDGAYSNIAVNSYLKEADLTPADKAFATALIYGVLDRKITLDYVISSFVKTPIKKLSPFTLNVLRTALFQIMYMDKIPESAAVNEAVKLIKKSKESRNSGFVNAVLRNVLRAESLLPTGDSVKDLSVIYSCPENIIESFINDYGNQTAVILLAEALKPAPLTVRVNTVKTDIETFIKEMPDSVAVKPSGAVVINKGIDINNNTLYKYGHFYVQDTASQTAVSVLSPKAGDRVLDMCAAPGGKSFSLALLMENKGEIISCDIYDHKCELIKKSADRLGLDIIKPIVQDGTVYNSDLGEFDCVLCDVPCSGLGIIRRKPDIKYKDFSEFDGLLTIQKAILNNAKKYVKTGGKLLYSTCTLRKAENENIVNEFLAQNSDFKLEYSHTFMPHIDGTDGFYCALLIKK